MSVLVSDPRGVFVTSLVGRGPISEQFLARRVTLTMREISLDISIEIFVHLIKNKLFKYLDPKQNMATSTMPDSFKQSGKHGRCKAIIQRKTRKLASLPKGH